MHDWNYYNENRIMLTDGEPRQKLKITGTRFATVLGFNDWSTPFEAWCEITKTAKQPFEDTIYTKAGKAIEPKVIEYCKEKISPYVMNPEEWFGNKYEEMKYDFFPEEKILGGMWDAVVTNKNGNKIRSIIEIKTTKRAEDWVDHPPVYYLLQACLYAYLEGVDQIIMSVTFLKDDDYKHPENFVVSDENTKMFMYSRYDVQIDGHPFDYYISKVIEWYDAHVKGAVSPAFDEKKDAEILKILRLCKPENDSGVDHLIEALNQKEDELKELTKKYGLDVLEKEIKALKEAVKKDFVSKIGDKERLEYGGWSLTRGKPKETADIEKLKFDGLIEYIKVAEGTLTLRKVSKK